MADNILLKNSQCQDVDAGVVDLLEVFFNTATVKQYGIDPILKGLASHQEYEMDLKVNSVLRNMLFGDPNSPVTFGLDLVSLNIQRGRDHGLPNYNKVRQYYMGSAATTFAQITTADSTVRRLQTLYGNVNNIDLWVGLLAEDQLPNKSVGKTLHAILKSQFESLRDGDYYFYLNDPAFTTRERDLVRKTRFSDLIKRNTTITDLQANAFVAFECPEAVANLAANSSAVAKPKASSFSIFPNPVNDVLTITTGKNISADAHLDLYNLQGVLLKTIKTVKDYETMMLNVNDLVPGVYIMSLTTNGKPQTKEFTKL